MASDRDRTPYTEAVLHEVQRRGNITAIAFHSAARDCQLGGHHVPKGTQVGDGECRYMGFKKYFL